MDITEHITFSDEDTKQAWKNLPSLPLHLLAEIPITVSKENGHIRITPLMHFDQNRSIEIPQEYKHLKLIPKNWQNTKPTLDALEFTYQNTKYRFDFSAF
jgi:hypothetical protein